MRELAVREGIFCGVSSGGAVAGAMRVAQENHRAGGGDYLRPRRSVICLPASLAKRVIRRAGLSVMEMILFRVKPGRSKPDIVAVQSQVVYGSVGEQHCGTQYSYPPA